MHGQRERENKSNQTNRFFRIKSNTEKKRKKNIILVCMIYFFFNFESFVNKYYVYKSTHLVKN